MTDHVVPALAPYEYALVYTLRHGPLSGGEVATTWPVQSRKIRPTVAGTQLRRIALLTGFVERSDDRLWHLTERGRAWLQGGATA